MLRFPRLEVEEGGINTPKKNMTVVPRAPGQKGSRHQHNPEKKPLNSGHPGENPRHPDEQGKHSGMGAGHPGVPTPV